MLLVSFITLKFTGIFFNFLSIIFIIGYIYISLFCISTEKIIIKEDYLIIQALNNNEKVLYSKKILLEEVKKVYFKNTFGISLMLDPGILNYLFNSKHFLDYTKSNTKMSTIWKLSNNLLKQYTFKLPNLETQQKIVDLLDNFDKYIFWITKSNFWLENLIKNNQKLLNYYLDKLVNF